MKKNVLSCLLAVLLLFGAAAAPQQVFAAGTVEISTVSGAKGEVVDVTVGLKSDDVYSGNFTIRYDSKVLELVSANSEAVPSIYCVVNGADEGTVRVTFTGVAEPIKDTVLCKLVFRITADTPTGGSAVSAEQLRLYNANGVLVDASAIAGSVAKKDGASRSEQQRNGRASGRWRDGPSGRRPACGGRQFHVYIRSEVLSSAFGAGAGQP